MRIRILTLAHLAIALVLAFSPLSASAQVEQVLVGASGISGIQFDTWAVGEVPEIQDGQALRLSRVHFDSCTGVVLHNTGGSTLLFAESGAIQYVFQGGESYPDTVLAQGESVAADPSAYLTIINPTSDPAYSVDLLVLSVTEGDSFVEIPMIEEFDFPAESFCEGINETGLVTPEILAEGVAGEDAEALYIGSAVFNPGATTEGWALQDEETTFNLLLLNGGMMIGGPGTGRAAWIGPGGVQKVWGLDDDEPLVSSPLVNDGRTPIFGIAFGTLEDAGETVWLPEQ